MTTRAPAVLIKRRHFHPTFTLDVYLGFKGAAEDNLVPEIGFILESWNAMCRVLEFNHV